MSYQNYKWYRKVEDNSLQQGDLIPICPIIVPPATIELGGEYEVTVNKFNIIVISQSCDLEQSKVEIVQVCTYVNFKEYYNAIELKSGIKEKKFIGPRTGFKTLHF